MVRRVPRTTYLYHSSVLCSSVEFVTFLRETRATWKTKYTSRLNTPDKQHVQWIHDLHVHFKQLEDHGFASQRKRLPSDRHLLLVGFVTEQQSDCIAGTGCSSTNTTSGRCMISVGTRKLAGRIRCARVRSSGGSLKVRTGKGNCRL